MHLDLGCGDHKHINFFGIDKVDAPGVDLLCDIDSGIPLPDNTVEFVMASRSLPYVTDLPAVLSDIYRICSHKAIVCVLAPYAHHFRHVSNPYLKHKFDEYTPRYFTNSFLQPPGGQVCPPVPDYNNEKVPYDFRLIRMEFFYEPPYSTTLYEQDELDMLQYVQPNLISEIMYHFVVLKQEIPVKEWHRICHQSYFEPDRVSSLRLQTPLPEVPAESTVPDDTTTNNSPLPTPEKSKVTPKKKPKSSR
ncbi:hypothetical protein A8709_28295 [Paenibacillus pectinilyticus]|uniref:Methyltransferase type 11 domain-containing protein n=1 Tax=Paenibacillus pectinilyticus TaxID=512399 RepID=A0A1C0ZUJ5_9BACL|nr:hypothetical protein [Paenibacillus pectinilyticus]OCT11774.1 hypothetical protein A8709_28295 [Paenibacillus pectinilyticus]